MSRFHTFVAVAVLAGLSGATPLAKAEQDHPGRDAWQRVDAVDVNPSALKRISDATAREGLTNVTLVQGTHPYLSPDLATTQLKEAGFEIAQLDRAFTREPVADLTQWLLVAQRPARRSGGL